MVEKHLSSFDGNYDHTEGSVDVKCLFPATSLRWILYLSIQDRDNRQYTAESNALECCIDIKADMN